MNDGFDEYELELSNTEYGDNDYHLSDASHEYAQFNNDDVENRNENRYVRDVDSNNTERVKGINYKAKGLHNCEEDNRDEKYDSSNSKYDLVTRLSKFMKGETFTYT